MWDPDRAKPGPIGLRDFKMDMQSLASCVNYTWPVGISGSVLLGLRWEGNAHVCVCYGMKLTKLYVKGFTM